eukprot:TRINITY_DN1463_c0_g1_i1.p1 TRINITY_DN1463_c0_g1~~TRINITY_DN1463_c0_g1_i1.p1  ORF type:complete len:817 (+),score=129.60 TRINITY_DN1463_c0_g1_i1:23-2473(+)
MSQKSQDKDGKKKNDKKDDKWSLQAMRESKLDFNSIFGIDEDLDIEFLNNSNSKQSTKISSKNEKPEKSKISKSMSTPVVIVDSDDSLEEEKPSKSQTNTNFLTSIRSSSQSKSKSKDSLSKGASKSEPTLSRVTDDKQNPLKRKEPSSKVEDSSPSKKRKLKSPYSFTSATNTKTNPTTSSTTTTTTTTKTTTKTTTTKKTTPLPKIDRTGTEIWVEKYKPLNQTTLSVAKAKYKAVVEALTKAFQGELRLIILVGPPGCGKTATVNVIANLTNIDVIPWINPTQCTYKNVDNNDVVSENNGSILAPFISFIQREKYPSLLVEEKPKKNRLIVIEDLPHFHTQSQRQKFQDAVKNHILNSSVSTPCVFINSDSGSGSNTVDFLFSKDVLNDPKVLVIKFNPIVVAEIKKCLNRIIESEIDSSELSTKLPSYSQNIESIAETCMGDIRSAINTLQFATSNIETKKQTNQPNKVTVTKTRKKAKKDTGSTTLVSSNNPSKDLFCTGRDFSLSLFHALGKVFYNKRLESVHTPSPSKHLISNAAYELNSCLKLHAGYKLRESLERTTMKSDPSSFYKDVYVDAPIFNQFLQENYIKFFDDITDVDKACSYLSDSSLLSDSVNSYVWRNFEQVQDLYCWNLSTRGIMWSNEHQTKSQFTPLVKPHITTLKKTSQNNSTLLTKIYSNYQKFSKGNGQESIKVESINSLSTDLIPYVAMMLNSSGSSGMVNMVPQKQQGPSKFSPSQKSFILTMRSYSPPNQDSNYLRGSARLQEFDSYFQDLNDMNLDEQRNKILSNNISEETRKQLTNQILAYDDIEDT